MSEIVYNILLCLKLKSMNLLLKLLQTTTDKDLHHAALKPQFVS